MEIKELCGQLTGKQRKELVGVLAELLLTSEPEEKAEENAQTVPNNAPMRTIHKAYEELKAGDPASCLSETAIKRLVLSGEIPHITAGGKRLINMDILKSYLSGTYKAKGARQ